MRAIYSLGIWFYGLSIRIAALFNDKAEQWVKGRRGNWKKLTEGFSAANPGIWFHCASLGEFEQGRPVIEAIKARYPGHKILLTFFSPSGYEVRKDYTLADLVCYLPLDTPAAARRFVSIVKPEAAFFVKYEYWYNYLMALNRENIPVFMVSSIFRPGQYFFKPWAFWFRGQLGLITHFFVQNNESQELLQNIGINNVSLSGDTRFDRVFAVTQKKKPFPAIERFASGSHLLLAGSSWPKDEALMQEFILSRPEGLKFIIAPHEVYPKRVLDLKKTFNARLFSEIKEDDDAATENVLIIDRIGILSQLYQYAWLAFIGGGFGKGIHNILEAAAFGVPVVFGPNHLKFQEARDLVALGGAKSIADSVGFIAHVSSLKDQAEEHAKRAAICRNYVLEKKGATELIIKKTAPFIQIR